MIAGVKLVVQVKLAPDAVQAPAVERTLRGANEAANWVSALSFDHFGLKGSVRELRKLCYGELKARGFGAQAAQHVIKRVATPTRHCGRASGPGTWGRRDPDADAGPSPSRSSSARTRRTRMTIAVCRGTATRGL